MRGAIILCIAAVLFVRLVAVSFAARDADPTVVSVTTPTGATIAAELADSPLKRAQGLMFRDALPRDRGMLFTFTEAQPWTFWMKNTRISLDIIWMDRNKKVVHVESRVPICTRTDDSCPQYQPIQDAMFVLEVAAGMAQMLGLQKGARVKFQVPESR